MGYYRRTCGCPDGRGIHNIPAFSSKSAGIKRGKIAPALFHNIFNIPLTSGVILHIFTYEMWLFDLFFLNSANLICQGTDISKYFRALGL